MMAKSLVERHINRNHEKKKERQSIGNFPSPRLLWPSIVLILAILISSAARSRLEYMAATEWKVTKRAKRVPKKRAVLSAASLELLTKLMHIALNDTVRNKNQTETAAIIDLILSTWMGSDPQLFTSRVAKTPMPSMNQRIKFDVLNFDDQLYQRDRLERYISEVLPSLLKLDAVFTQEKITFTNHELALRELQANVPKLTERIIEQTQKLREQYKIAPGTKEVVLTYVIENDDENVADVPDIPSDERVDAVVDRVETALAQHRQLAAITERLETIRNLVKM